MAAAIVQYGSVDVGNTDTRNITFGAELTAGNAVLLAMFVTNTFVTLTDLDLHDGSSTEAISQTPIVSEQDMGGGEKLRWYLIADIGSGWDQLRSICTGWAPGRSFAIEVSGLGAAPTVSDSDADSFSSVDPVSMAFSPADADGLVMAMIMPGGSDAPTVTDGVGWSPGSGFQHAAARVYDASGAQSLDADFGGSVSGNFGLVAIAAEAGGDPPIDADAAFTEPNETLTGAGTVRVTGSATFTEANETLSGAGTVAVVAAADFTEPNETLSSSVSGTNLVNAAFTEPNETMAAAAAVAIVAALSATEANETLSSAAVTPIGADATPTEPNETLAGAAAVRVTAIADFTEPNETAFSTVDTGVGFQRVGHRRIRISSVGIGL